ncbi:MAG: hypothetical protein HC836_47030, partial [Richelia sp. RM2_1_2]|nr:hypothetical protein [Richelia sp. RM2_1_2]
QSNLQASADVDLNETYTNVTVPACWGFCSTTISVQTGLDANADAKLTGGAGAGTTGDTDLSASGAFAGGLTTTYTTDGGLAVTPQVLPID